MKPRIKILNITIFIVSFLFFSPIVSSQVRIAKELKGTWEGEVYVYNNNGILEGKISIVLGAFLSESKDQIEFYINEFSQSKRKMFRYIQTELKDDEHGFRFNYELPYDEYESFVEGSYDFTLKQKDELSYLIGEFSDNGGVNKITATFVLLRNKDYKKMKDSHEYEQLVSEIISSSK